MSRKITLDQILLLATTSTCYLKTKKKNAKIIFSIFMYLIIFLAKHILLLLDDAVNIEI